MTPELKQLEADLEVLASGARLCILQLLLSTPLMSVTDLTEILGLRHSNTSQHLQKLLARGFVSSIQDANFVRYAADAERVRSVLARLTNLLPGETNANP